jgi:glycosyltransferase involved in cell wall biosynthesis
MRGSVSQLPSVLFVSKPIAPPFHDGAKCLVRDLATSYERHAPIVMTTGDAPDLGPAVKHDRLYPTAGAFAPALSDNARVLARLVLGPFPSVWHFVFAPNPASSTAAKVARRLRRVPTVQTVASAPRSFENVQKLLFGDAIVALSEHTRSRLVAGGADPSRITVVPPTVPRIADPSREALARARAEIGVSDDRPLVVYPGDVETSNGARLTAAAVPAIFAAASDATIVFACRKKTERAEQAEAKLRAELAPFGDRVRFVGEVSHLPDLLASASVVLFPVDDLYGKVDLPIALLEAMSLRIPVVALDAGPLAELEGAVRVGADAAALARACGELLVDRARRADVTGAAEAAIDARHRPEGAARAYEAIYDRLLGRRAAEAPGV